MSAVKKTNDELKNDMIEALTQVINAYGERRSMRHRINGNEVILLRVIMDERTVSPHVLYMEEGIEWSQDVREFIRKYEAVPTSGIFPNGGPHAS